MKKILSMVLVLVLALSCFAVASVSAADEFVPSEEPIIYFEVPENWGDYTKIFCHIWSYGGEPLANWQSKKESCTATDVEGVYSYDISKAGGLEDGIMYCVIFSADNGAQTYDCLMDKNCFGDSLYCDGTIYENPEDSSKTCQAAFWRNQDKLKYGPIMQITSIGNITGTALPPGATVESVITDFVTSGKLDNALMYVDKTADEILATIAQALNVSDEQLADILASIDYNPSSGDEATPDEYLLGDSDGDTKVNVKDATAIQKWVAGYEIEIDLDCADADLNETVNVKDATAVQKWVAGIQVSTPIGELYSPAKA